MDALQGKSDRLLSLLAEMGSAVVAYSGGVDSAFLAARAHGALAERALMVTANSPALAPAELAEARTLAQANGWRHRVINTSEMERPEYVANGPRRCFFCKTELYGHLERLAEVEGYTWVANGTNCDDLGDYRPGLDAAREHRVRSPLVEAGLSKAEIRALSQQLGLPTWDKPAQPCLSSRIPYGTPVTVEALNKIAQAEAYLHGLGIRQLRVRHFGSKARIEVDPPDLARLNEPAVLAEVRRVLQALGYTEVALEQFRSGRLNEALALPGNQGQGVAARSPGRP
ncbi:MAG: ATP-dependent sacrificial sulfur transferase LarE [Dehalococcoidia bacterium]|nr:ATP-dependent sacrificial sulfur transferase LarE [Dehalococcoidia bacterium]